MGSSPPTAAGDNLVRVHSFVYALRFNARARGGGERSAMGLSRAVSQRRFLFCDTRRRVAGGAGELGGLRRQQRIATTWAWASDVLALGMRVPERSDRERIEFASERGTLLSTRCALTRAREAAASAARWVSAEL